MAATALPSLIEPTDSSARARAMRVELAQDLAIFEHALSVPATADDLRALARPLVAFVRSYVMLEAFRDRATAGAHDTESPPPPLVTKCTTCDGMGFVRVHDDHALCTTCLGAGCVE